MPIINLSVTGMCSGIVHVEANSVEEAIEKYEEDPRDYEVCNLTEGESMQLDTDDPEEVEDWLPEEHSNSGVPVHKES